MNPNGFVVFSAANQRQLHHQLRLLVGTYHQGLTKRQRVRHRLLNSDYEHEVDSHRRFTQLSLTDLVAPLSAMSRSLRSGTSLRQAITESGALKSTGVIHQLSQRLNSGQSLEDICADLQTKVDREPENETALVIQVIGLAHSMGGDEARLIDSLIHTLIERRHILSERQAQAATALSSMRLLTWLPLICGLWMISESPPSRSFILHTTTGKICLFIGIGLNLVGRLWARKIVGAKC